MAAEPEPKIADHKRMMELVAQLSPESRVRIAQGLDDRFHELTSEQQDGGAK